MGVTDGDLTAEQWLMLAIMPTYFFIILLLWYVPLLLFPWKLFTVFLHEMSHAFAGVLTCARIKSIEINLDEGGVTHMKGGIQCITLPAGYTGSAIFGAFFIVLSFSRVLAIWAGLLFALIMFIALWWAKRNIVALLVSILFLFILLVFEALALSSFDYRAMGVRLYIGFIGVMSCMFSTYDIWEDTIKRRSNKSDAAQCADMTGCPSQMWGIVWFFISLNAAIFSIIAGLLINEGLDERLNVNPTPWTDNKDPVPSIHSDFTLDLLIAAIVVSCMLMFAIVVSPIYFLCCRSSRTPACAWPCCRQSKK